MNLHGEMVGLTVSLAAALGYEQAAGFAIPVDETFSRALKALKQGSEVEYGFLGVELPLSTDPRVRASSSRSSRSSRGLVPRRRPTRG